MGEYSKFIVGVIFILMLVLTGCDHTDINKYDVLFNATSEKNTTKEEIKEEIIPIEDIPEFDRNLEEIEIEDIDENHYIIGAWNIKVFGVSKASNEYLMPVISDIIDDYDIIFLQEIRDKTGTVENELDLIEGYDYKISERLGRSSSKEQYVYMYSERVGIGEDILYEDVNDDFEREPYIMEFIIDDYEFVIIGIHAKPSDCTEEIKALNEVVEWTRVEFDNDNIFIMGDLNFDKPYCDERAKLLPEFNKLIKNDFDTNVASSEKTYDRIFALQDNPKLFGVGVDDLTEEVGDDRELLEAVSDHFPVFFTLKN